MSEMLKAAVSELKAACQNLEGLLKTVGAVDWANEINVIDERDYSSQLAVQASLEMFGGSGSVSDWVISVRNGHKLNGVSSLEANDELDRLRGKVYQLLCVIDGLSREREAKPLIPY